MYKEYKMKYIYIYIKDYQFQQNYLVIPRSVMSRQYTTLKLLNTHRNFDFYTFSLLMNTLRSSICMVFWYIYLVRQFYNNVSSQS